MKMTNEERQALIGMLEGEIARYERLGMSGLDKGTSCHELDQWFRMSAYRLALAALTAEPVVPDGWEACSPEWIERNGPCSCANAPRLAFGSVGQHYHPHIFIDNTAQQYEALAKEDKC